MPQQPHRPAALVEQIFRGSLAVDRGLLTKHQLRSTAWVRVLNDVYADAWMLRDHRLKCQAATLRLPPSGVFSGPSAAYLDGVEFAASYLDDVHLTVPTKLRVGPLMGLRIHRADLLALQVLARDDFPRTTPARTAWDVGAWLSLEPAVAIIDGLLARGLVDPAELAVVATQQAERPLPGSRRARRAFALADGGARTPAESRLRVRLVTAGLPHPVSRPAVRVPGGGLVEPDLAWPSYHVAAERETGATTRLEPLRAGGWVVVPLPSPRMTDEFAGAVRELSEALRHRGWQP